MGLEAGYERLLVLVANAVDIGHEKLVNYGVSLSISSADTDFLLRVSGAVFVISQTHIWMKPYLTRHDRTQLNRALDRARRDKRIEDVAVLKRIAYCPWPKWMTVCVEGARTMAGGVTILLVAVKYSTMAYPVMADKMGLLEDVDWLGLTRSSLVTLLDGLVFTITALDNLFPRGMSSFAWHVLAMGGLLTLLAIGIVFCLAWALGDQVQRMLGRHEQTAFMREGTVLQQEGEEGTDRPATDEEIRVLEAARERAIRDSNASTTSSPPAVMATNSTVATAGESPIDDMDYEPSRPYQACGSTAPATRKRSYDDMVERYDSVLSVSEEHSRSAVRPAKVSFLDVSINPELRCRPARWNTSTTVERPSYRVKETASSSAQASSSKAQPPKRPSCWSQQQALPPSTRKSPSTPQPPSSSTPNCPSTPTSLKPLPTRYKHSRPREGSVFDPCGPSCVAVHRDLTAEQMREEYPRLHSAYENLDEVRKARKRKFLHLKCPRKGSKREEEKDFVLSDDACDKKQQRRLAVSLAGGKDESHPRPVSNGTADTAAAGDSNSVENHKPSSSSASCSDTSVPENPPPTPTKRSKWRYFFAPSPDPHFLLPLRRNRSRPSTSEAPTPEPFWDGSSSSLATAGSGSSGRSGTWSEEGPVKGKGKGREKASARIESIKIDRDDAGAENEGEKKTEKRAKGVLKIR